MNPLPSITDVTDLRGKRVLVRASLNVPVKNGVVQNEFRLRRALPTLEFLKKAGARTIAVGHIGRPKAQSARADEPEETLEPVCEALNEFLPVTWRGGTIGPATTAVVAGLRDGDVIMLENLRGHDGERANDAEFAELLASLADVYVNDAFSASHREHASIVGVPQYLPSYAGINFAEECEELTKAQEPHTPSLFMLGGSKFETKLPLVEQYAEVYGHVFIGGALANDIWKARGLEVGRSLVSDVDLAGTKIAADERLMLPVDVTVQNANSDVRVTTPDDVHADEIIYDAGPETIEQLRPRIAEARTILWNGPLGYFEGGFEAYTKQCAKLIAESDAHSIVGGGDTIAAIESLDLHDRFGFVSTAGGAMLTFLESGTLPGIEALG